MKKLSLVVVVLSIVSSSAAFAQTKTSSVEKQWYVGPLAGVSIPTSGGTASTEFTWGGTAGYRLSDESSIGLYFSTLSPGTGATSNTLAAEYNWIMESGLYLGPRVGLAMSSFAGTSTSELLAGVQVGYDYPVAESITVGGQANWNIAFSDPVGHALNLVVPVKFWF